MKKLNTLNTIKDIAKETNLGLLKLIKPSAVWICILNFETNKIEYKKFDYQTESQIVKNKVKEKRKVLEKQQEKYNKTYLKVHDELKKSLPKFILDIYSSMHSKDNDFRTYSTYVMTKFINDFFSNSNARFTLRILDQNKNTMTSKITTREIAPSDIPLNKDNMISKSLKFKKPLIYSENKKYHYDTNISIEQKIFDDYVTYCIVAKDNNIPIISVNLDVKGEESVNRMKAFVKTNIFTIVCDAITLYYKIESSKKDEQNV